jgi:hypothetical protein
LVSFWNRARSRPRGGSVIDVLDAGLLTQSGIAQPGGKPLVAAMGELAIEQQAEPVSMGEPGVLVGSFELRRVAVCRLKGRSSAAAAAQNGSYSDWS